MDEPLSEYGPSREAQLLFQAVWESLEQAFTPDQLRFPAEMFWLNGAPGAGKGTHTQFILRHRGLRPDAAFAISDLLQSPEAKAIKDKGLLVGDKEVLGLMLRALLDPKYQHGVIIDGFPRTYIQVQCLRLFYQKLLDLSAAAAHLGSYTRKPRFHIIVLFIDEHESVLRQLYRGKQALLHNEKVKSSGVGQVLEIRKTDTDEQAARQRYQLFKAETYTALRGLNVHFPYHFIDAHGSIDAIKQKIVQELQYQSSFELDQATYQRIRSIPQAYTLLEGARQQLVERLDAYERDHPQLFQSVVRLIEQDCVPIIRRHALSGRAIINSECELLHDGLALSMLIDVFADRGYHATVDVQREYIPRLLDLQAGHIAHEVRKIYRMHIHFQPYSVYA
jgi:adenylate kinase